MSQEREINPIIEELRDLVRVPESALLVLTLVFGWGVVAKYIWDQQHTPPTEIKSAAILVSGELPSQNTITLKPPERQQQPRPTTDEYVANAKRLLENPVHEGRSFKQVMEKSGFQLGEFVWFPFGVAGSAEQNRAYMGRYPAADPAIMSELGIFTESITINSESVRWIAQITSVNIHNNSQDIFGLLPYDPEDQVPQYIHLGHREPDEPWRWFVNSRDLQLRYKN